jgi:hypothetical protein
LRGAKDLPITDGCSRASITTERLEVRKYFKTLCFVHGILRSRLPMHKSPLRISVWKGRLLRMFLCLPVSTPFRFPEQGLEGEFARREGSPKQMGIPNPTCIELFLKKYKPSKRKKVTIYHQHSNKSLINDLKDMRMVI